MSASYSWRPVVTPPIGGTFSLNMAQVLANRFNYGVRDDGEMRSIILTKDRDNGWLCGVRDSNSGETKADAIELLEALSRHDEIQIVVER